MFAKDTSTDVGESTLIGRLDCCLGEPTGIGDPLRMVDIMIAVVVVWEGFLQSQMIVMRVAIRLGELEDDAARSTAL